MGGEIANNFTGVWGGVLGPHHGHDLPEPRGLRERARHPGDQRRVPGDAELGRRAERAHRRARLGAGPRASRPSSTARPGSTYTAQRNIDYGSVNGNQMFLFDFTGRGTDTTPPTVAITSPASGAQLTGTDHHRGDGIGQRRRDQGRVLGRRQARRDRHVRPVLHDVERRLGRVGDAHADGQGLRPGREQHLGHGGVGDGHRHDGTRRSRITRPTNGSTVSRNTSVTIAATATDNRSVARVLFYVNNTLKCTDTTSAYSCGGPCRRREE